MSNTRNPEQTGSSIDHEGIVISIMASLGGTGKTTISTLLGMQLVRSSTKAAEQGLTERALDVCLVDFDITDGQLRYMVGQDKPNVMDLALSKKLLDETLVRDHLVYNEALGVHVLLAPIQGDPNRNADPAFYYEVIRLLKTMFDVIIMDTSADVNETMNRLVAVPQADAVLFVTTNSMSGASTSRQWVESVIGEEGVSKDKISVIFNGVTLPVKWDNEVVSTMFGAKVMLLIPHGGKEFIADGNTLQFDKMLDNPAVAPAYSQLAQWVAEKIDVTLS